MIAYEITNKMTGARYIGITRFNVSIRMRQHIRAALRGDGPSRALYNAIRKHGVGAFAVRELACSRTWEDLLLVEQSLIRQEDTHVPRGYNRTIGGEGIVGVPRSLEHNTKIRLAIKEVWATRTQDERRRISACLSVANKGRSLPEQQREKIRNALAGRAHSDAHNAAVSAAMRGNPKVGASRLGAIFSPEHKARISAAKIVGWQRKKAAIAACLELFGIKPPRGCRVTTISLPEWAVRDYDIRHQRGEFLPPQERQAA